VTSAAGVSGAGPVNATSFAYPAPASSSTALLPAPTVSPCTVDALYVMLSECAELQTKSGKLSAERGNIDRQRALADYMDAIQKQREADEGGFFDKLGLDTISKVAMVAVAAAAVVTTGGAALVVVGVALSAAGFAVEKTKCFGDKYSQWIGLGVSLTGGILTGVGVAGHAARAASAASAANAAAQSSAQTAASAAASASGGGFASAGASAAAGSTTAASGIATAKTATLMHVAEGFSAGTQLAQGAATAESTAYENVADHAGIDAREAQQRMARFERAMDDVIEQMSDAKKTKQSASERLGEIKETEDHTLLIAMGARA
jgi:hypothetical protein